MPKRNKIKRDEFMWRTPICTLKFDNHHYPYECVPFWDNWRNILAPEPDCTKCPVAKEFDTTTEE